MLKIWNLYNKAVMYMNSFCDFSSNRCKKFNEAKQAYDKIIQDHFRSYICSLRNFNLIVETRIRKIFGEGRSADQAWKSCKGSLYEYAVCKAIQEIFEKIPELKYKLIVMHGSKLTPNYRKQIVVANWSEILPDTDFAIINLENNNVKAIISCKTSIRERLTETGFWKKELSEKGIEYIFVTTDKDDEIKIDTNRYIIMHVLDYTIITDPSQLNKIISTWRQNYSNKRDFEKMIAKIGDIEKLCEILCNYAGLKNKKVELC